MENVKPIARSVEQLPAININKDNGPQAKAVNNETWLIRYQSLLKKEGYNNSKRTLHCLSIKDWQQKSGTSYNNRAPLFIEGNYFYNCINRQNKFVTFSKLRYCDLIKEKISYFSLYHKDDDQRIHNLFTSLRKEGYNLHTKLYDSYMDNGQSIASDLLIQMMAKIYSVEEPAVDHIILMASDSIFIPFIQYFRSISIKFTLVIAPTQVISNNYLNQFDYIIDAVELMQYANCIRSVSNGV